MQNSLKVISEKVIIGLARDHVSTKSFNCLVVCPVKVPEST